MTINNTKKTDNKSQHDLSVFLNSRQYLKIVHHVAGRIRLRISSSLFKELDGTDPKMLQKILQAIPAIRDVRINSLAGSVVISYAPDTLRPRWWETLIKGDRDEAATLLAQLLDSTLAPAVDVVRGSETQNSNLH